MRDEIMAQQGGAPVESSAPTASAKMTGSATDACASCEDTPVFTKERIRRMIAAFGGASRLARQLTETFGDPIGESGVRAWTAQGAVPLRRCMQLARLARSVDLLVDADTLEVCMAPTSESGCDPLLHERAAFLSLDAIAVRWSIPQEQVEMLIKDHQLPVHDLAGTERISCADLLDYERRARRRASGHGTSIGNSS